MTDDISNRLPRELSRVLSTDPDFQPATPYDYLRNTVCGLVRQTTDLTALGILRRTTVIVYGGVDVDVDDDDDHYCSPLP